MCVYWGSSDAVPEVYKASARALGRLLARRGHDLVFGGGRVGLMGTIADTVLEEGGRVWGVIPRKLMERELGHDGCTELFVVDGMHARKTMMAQLADGFIALPGGWGTMEELFEMATWLQLGYHDKPVGLLDVDGYYGPLLAWLDRARDVGFVRPGDRDLVIDDTDPARLLERMAAAPPRVRA
ncbi:MAG: TIGR00730 family Rossman fold protein [Alphaproteobacteria bacterium]|nr:TIGR00730 family Rossman fold protein [Alphaproteobacteria bacterium]